MTIIRFHGSGSLVDSVTFRAISLSYLPLANKSVPDKWIDAIKPIKSYLPVLMVWFVAGLVLSQAYTSNLLANLVKVEYERSPKVFQVN